MNNKIAIGIFFSFVMLFSFQATAQDLVILHTNDTHSQIEPIRIGLGKGLGGVHRRAEYFQKVKRENKNVLILDAGDFNQGTPYFTLFHGDMELELMNALGYEAVTLGNHEFDNGEEDLARRLSKARFKILCANYDFTGTPLEKYVKPYIVIREAGKKIGIFGLTTDLTSLVAGYNIAGMKYRDAFTVADETASFLKNQMKCDLVIALTHIGYRGRDGQLSDYSLAKASRDIDIVIGGHSHTFLQSEVLVENLEGKNVIVVTSGALGEYVGRLDITF